ncbi:unnamed protein product [Phytomonas sp. EM1]|nr:unnamed protein product [Phytomonas sp. EM1]|eukprot:CCW64305.1 unnamed protein product [Phytomonas sp. isolate EM1]
MDEFLDSLPSALISCTSIGSLEKAPKIDNLNYSDVAKCFMYARRSSIHTQPLPSSSKEIKKALHMLSDTHCYEMDTFFSGYMYPYEDIPDSVLDAIRIQCTNLDCKRAFRYQMQAFDVLCNEVRAKSSVTTSSAKLGNTSSLLKLRQILPAIKYVPKVSIKHCHFRFIGTLSLDPSFNQRVFAASISFRNNGQRPLILKVTQIQIIIDGVKTESKSFQGSGDSYELIQGESIDLDLSIKEVTQPNFTEFQQILVISINEVLKVFVTFLVLSPKQRLFHQRFPACMVLNVVNSPLGTYTAPLMLQIFKHVFIWQKGLSSAAVIRLMMDKSANYRTQNREIMREVLRIKELLQEQLDLSKVLDNFWNSFEDIEGFPIGRRYKLPPSSAQPHGYSPAADSPAFRVSIGYDCLFPNRQTWLPDCLTHASPEVSMGLILLWLADMDAVIFEASFGIEDPIAYLVNMPAHLRGIILWILDLCCALIHNSVKNGATGRGLALTFTNILMRRKAEAFGDAGLGTPNGDLPNSINSFFGSSFLSEVEKRQTAVTVFLHWLKIYAYRYEKAL